MEQQKSSTFFAGFKRGLWAFRVFGGFMVIWLLVGLVPKFSVFFQQGNLLVAVIIFVLGLPLSAFLRIDQLTEMLPWTSSYSNHISLLLTTVVAALNFGVISGIRAMLRKTPNNDGQAQN